MNKSIALTLSMVSILCFLTACRHSETPPAAPPAPPLSGLVPAHGDTAFPAEVLRSIFRSDFPFVTRLGEVSPVSVPPTRPGCGVKLLCDGAARAFDDNHEYFKLRREGRLPTNRAAWFKKAWWEVSGSKPPPLEQDPKQGRLDLGGAELDDPAASVRFLRHRPRAKEDYSKFAVIDQQVIILGSCNLDPRSLGLNSEDVALIDSSKAAAALTAFVERVDLPNCERITRGQALDWRRPEDHSDKFTLLFGKAVEDWY